MVVVDHLPKYVHLCALQPIYSIHGGSNIHRSGLQSSWHATLYCFLSRPKFHKKFLARTIQDTRH
jgi:hypothetical protein